MSNITLFSVGSYVTLYVFLLFPSGSFEDTVVLGEYIRPVGN